MSQATDLLTEIRDNTEALRYGKAGVRPAGDVIWALDDIRLKVRDKVVLLEALKAQNEELKTELATLKADVAAIKAAVVKA